MLKFRVKDGVNYSDLQVILAVNLNPSPLNLNASQNQLSVIVSVSVKTIEDQTKQKDPQDTMERNFLENTSAHRKSLRNQNVNQSKRKSATLKRN